MSENHLLHPELVRGIPVVGRIAENMLVNRVNEALEDPRSLTQYGDLKTPDVTVVIRTLNERWSLYWLLDDIDMQGASPSTEIVVVDNESSDDTVAVAKEFGATVVSLARDDFTYPKSINLGIEAASNELVFLTVGHARLSNRFQLAGSARHFEESDMGGVFSRPLPNTRASYTENFLGAFGVGFLRKAHQVNRVGMGILGATNCMIKKSIWRNLGKFDENYGMGGEDERFAELMVEEGLIIIEDPVSTVHHSHGLGPINYARQWRRWGKSSSPHPINLEKIAKSRPDLDLRKKT